MQLLLLKAFRFNKHHKLPYRIDYKGGNVFYGVGSHVLYSNLEKCWYRLALEVATRDQPSDSTLEATRLTASVNGQKIEIRQGILEWDDSYDYRSMSCDPRLSSYQWTQYLGFDLEEPALVEIRVEMKFSDQADYLGVDGVTRFLVDLHPGKPPTYYSKPVWWLRRLVGKRD